MQKTKHVKVYNDLGALMEAKRKEEAKRKKNHVRGGGWSFISDDDDPLQFSEKKRVLFKRKESVDTTKNEQRTQGLSFYDQIKNLDIQWEQQLKTSQKDKKVLWSQPRKQPKQQQNKSLLVEPQTTEKKKVTSKSFQISQLVSKNDQQQIRRPEDPPKITTEIKRAKSQQSIDEDLQNKKIPPPVQGYTEVVRHLKDSVNATKEGGGGTACYDLDEATSEFLENVSLEELQQLFNFKNVPFNDIDNFIDDNSDYFTHGAGVCACWRCTCGNCRCVYSKVKYPSRQLQTIYSKEYIRNHNVKSESYRTPPLYQSFYDSKLHNGASPIKNQYLTTNMINYVQHQMPESERKISPKSRANYQMNGTSAYQSAFQNWNNYNSKVIFGRPFHVSVLPELSLEHKTTYSQSYINPERSEAREPKNNLIREAYSKAYPTLMSTSYKQHYNSNEHGRDWQNCKLSYKYLSQTEVIWDVIQQKKYQEVPGFTNQYQTSQKYDFQNSPLQQCPAKEKKSLFQKRFIDKLKEAAKMTFPT